LGILDVFKRKGITRLPDYTPGNGQFHKNANPIWSTSKDEDYIKEAYNQIAWVYACVSILSGCVTSVDWCLYRKQRNGKMIEIEEHPILKIVNYQANPHYSSRDFFDLWTTYLALEGKFFAVLNNSVLPTELNWIYPHKTKPIPDVNTFVSGFEYDKITYKPENIMWSRFHDPLDAYQGLSPIKAVARTIDSENEAIKWNKNTLENSAVPPGAIQVENPSPELMANLKTEWIKRYAGSNNARVPLILNSQKARYVNFGMNPVDMDFMQQRKLNRTEICAVFGVPSQAVNDPQSTIYANSNDVARNIWKNTIIPKYLTLMRSTLNKDIVAKYGDNLYLNYNLDDVDALHESRDSVADRHIRLFMADLISKNEAREALGYGNVGKDVFHNDLTSTVETPKEVLKGDENK